MAVDLDKLSIKDLARVGDEAMRSQDYALARTAYGRLQARAPTESHVLTRLGLAHAPSRRSGAVIEILKIIEQFVPRRVFLSEGLATWFKTVPFFDDDRYMILAARHAHLLPLPNWHWNLQTVVWAVEQARRLDGDFVELGVFKGHTTLFTAEYVGFADWPRRWWLYDTFDGVPEDQLDAGWSKANESMYRNTFSFEEVRDRFNHLPNIEVIKGRVPEILLERAPEKIAFLHVDLNNATAEIQALELLFDRIVSGGIIVFDDYVWLASRAQYEAEKAWFAARGLVVLPLPTGQGVFVKQ